MATVKREAAGKHGSSARGGVSVALLAALLFVALAFAVYVFPAFPFLLGLILIAEWGVLGFTVLHPVFSEPARKQWVRPLIAVVVALALANIYMLFLARAWGVGVYGWYGAALRLQGSVVAAAAHAAAYVAGFLDAMLKALFGLRQGPIGGGLDHLRRAGTGVFRLPLAAPGALKLGLLVNLAIGLAASVMGAQIIRRLIARAR